MITSVRTDVGLVRSNNEDSYLYQPPRLFAVADGMGGHAAGETASAMAVAMIMKYAEQGQSMTATELTESIEAANVAIYERARQEEGMQGMGTTTTAVLLAEKIVSWAHVGDSRLYHLTNGQWQQVTQDHTLVGELVRNGTLTINEAKEHPRRNLLTRAVGTSKDLRVEQGQFEVKPGDSLLLCTDGLTGVVSDSELQSVLSQAQASMDDKADQLMTMAKEAGAPDNVTFIILACETADYGG